MIRVFQNDNENWKAEGMGFFNRIAMLQTSSSGEYYCRYDLYNEIFFLADATGMMY